MGSRPPFARRVPYHLDGTEVFWLRESTNEILQLDSEALDALNSSRLYATDYPDQPDWFTLMFPVPMKIFGFYLAAGGGGDAVASGGLIDPFTVDIETSTDTTTSVDGTWQPVGTYPSSCLRAVDMTTGSGGLLNVYKPIDSAYSGVKSMRGVDVISSYRKQFDLDGEGIHRLSGAGLRGVKALRFRTTVGQTTINPYVESNFHLYGEPENLPAERLQIVLPDGSALSSGSTGFGQQQTQVPSSPRELRLLNRSLTKRATGVELSIDQLLKSSTVWLSSVAAQAEFSLDGTTGWDTTLALPNIEPGESAAFFVRAMPQGPNGFSNNYGAYATTSHLGWFQNLMIPTVTEWVDA